MRLSRFLNVAEPIPPPVIPSLANLESACQRVLRRWPDVEAAPKQDRETVVIRMLRRVQNDDWDGSKLAEVIRAGRVAFEQEYRYLLEFRDLRKFYYDETQVTENRSFLGAVMSIYLSTYEPDAIHTRSLAASLQNASHRLGGRWVRLLDQVPNLLHPQDAAMSIASAMRSMEDPWVGLKAMGFQNPHAQGLLYHAHLGYINQMRSKLKIVTEIQRMLRWLSPEGVESRSSGVKEALNALIEPWVNHRPNDEVRDTLIEGLVSAYGDPRVRRGGAWSDVREDCRRVLLSWLTRANIHFFLDVVSESEESHMWQPRREFWLGLYEEGWVNAAWVAFSPNAELTAKRLGKQGDRGASLEYGKQIAGGSRRTTSLLILKIGRCVVVEGSHSYKVQVFRDTGQNAPELFEKTYDCERIRSVQKLGEQIHHSGWQEKVRDLVDRWRN